MRVSNIIIKGEEECLTEYFFDSNFAKGKDPVKQVSIMSKEAVDKVQKRMDKGLCMKRFRSNLVISNISTKTVELGDILIIDDLEIEVNHLGKKCFLDDCKIYDENEQCFMIESVLYGRIIKAGRVLVGSEVFVKDYGLS